MPINEYRDESCCNTEPVSVVRWHLQRCNQEFGVTCDGTGEPCYQTIETCKDRCNFQCEIRDNIHTTCATKQVGLHRPDIKSHPRVTGGKLKLCEGLPGPRKVTVTLQDTPSCDIIDDPFADQREHYGQTAPGTELEKFRGRHIIEGRRFTLQSGFCGADYPSSFISRAFYGDSFDGPDASCCYQLTGKDALGFFNLADSKWPAEGNYKTVADITPLIGPGDLVALDPRTPDDAQAICIGGESIKVEVSANQQAADRKLFTVIERAACGSTRSESVIDARTDYNVAGYIRGGTNAGDAIFMFLHQDGEGLPWQPVDCECGPIQDPVIDATQFGQMISGCLSPYVLPEIIVCQPTSIRQLLKEIEVMSLIKPIMCEETGMIELYQHKPPEDVSSLVTYTEPMTINFTAGSRSRDRVTQTVLNSHPIDCTKGVSDDNLINNYTTINAGFFGEACTNPEWRPQKVKEEKTRFLNTDNEYLGMPAISRLNYLFKNPAREIKFTVPAKHMQSKSGDFIKIEHPKLQQPDGDMTNDIFWVTQIDQLGDNNVKCFEITAETSGFTQDQRWFGFGTDCTPLTATPTDECEIECQAMIW